MKFIASGVTFSAAMVRSPSFSRSSSSTRMTMRPVRISLRACSTREIRRSRSMARSLGLGKTVLLQSVEGKSAAVIGKISRDQLLQVLGDQIDFQVDLAAARLAAQVGVRKGMRHQRYREAV